MTVVPLPTFVPQDAWFNITTGNYNPSVADTVPDVSYLLPANGQDAIVGPADGAIIGLRGETETMDGGQKWLVWDEDSQAVSDGVNVFNPFVETGTPGRWLAMAAAVTGPGVVQNVQTVEAGEEHNIQASTATFIQVFVLGRAAAADTTLNLPGTVFLGQTISVKDAEGDAGTHSIFVVGTIDNMDSFEIATNYQAQNFTWNGTEWSAV